MQVVSGSSTVVLVPAPVDESEAASDWDSLIAALTAHEDYLEQQSEGLSKQVVENVARFQKQIVALGARWAAAKPDGARAHYTCAPTLALRLPPVPPPVLPVPPVTCATTRGATAARALPRSRAPSAGAPANIVSLC